MKRVLAAAALAAASCSMPSTSVKTTDTRPSLAIEGAPSGSLLLVDGLTMGDTFETAGAVRIGNMVRNEVGNYARKRVF